MTEEQVEDGIVESPPYIYRAHLARVVDGDTIDVDIDCGFGIWLKKERLRLYGINTPETRGKEREEGLVAKAFVQAEMASATSILIKTYVDARGKYGRLLAEVYYRTPLNPDGPMVNLNRTLLVRGFAKPTLY